MAHAEAEIAMREKSGVTGQAKATPMTLLLLVAGGWPACTGAGRKFQRLHCPLANEKEETSP